jgi:hypothetical protein
VVEIIDERPLDAVVKEYPHHTEPPGQRGMLLFHHFALPPAGILAVFHPVSQLQIQPLPHILFYPTMPLFLPGVLSVVFCGALFRFC